MPKRNEKLIEAKEEITRLMFELVELRQQVKAARVEERIKIAALILKGEE
jgi:hypothetical protein